MRVPIYYDIKSKDYFMIISEDDENEEAMFKGLAKMKKRRLTI